MSKLTEVGDRMLKAAICFYNMEEIWKDVVGYEGMYQVSNLGRVKSLRIRRHKDGIMTTKVRKNGYVFIFLRLNNKRIWKSVHRLVAEAFILNPKNKPQIDHIDGNPSNNIVTNLRWVTAKENMNNPITLKRISLSMTGENNPFYGKHHKNKTKEAISKSRIGKYKGANNPFFGKHHTEETKKYISKKAKERGGIPVVQYTKDGLLVKVWEHATIAGKTLGISPSSISACCRKKRKTIGGYKWKYLYE